MQELPRTTITFPRAILHIDGDAFFASCEQSRNPKLKDKPVVTGKERGIAASMSYEAKAMGVTRGMRIAEIKKVCPNVILLPSDYETYSLLSQRFFAIVRRFTPEVEEYGIDECFADLTGLRRPLRMNYLQIAEKIKKELAIELGFTFSIGLACSKVVAKIASKWNKPSGLTAIPGRKIHIYLKDLSLEKIWGIGPQTSAYLQKLGVVTALQFAQKSEEWVKDKLTKPAWEIWQELNGKFVLQLQTKAKESYASIQKFKTFTPPSRDRNFIFAQLSKNIESACIKARRYQLAAKEAVFILRTQSFEHTAIVVKFSRPTAFPNEIVKMADSAFAKIFASKKEYRATGVVLANLVADINIQPDLFGSLLKIEKMEKLYKGVDEVAKKYGKHTLFLGSSLFAHPPLPFDKLRATEGDARFSNSLRGSRRFAQHLGERGDLPQRKTSLFNGESTRKRLGIPTLNL